MDFTREPIIETIITPKEGYKLAVRNSKGAGQEEFFVDAVEVVSFGHSFFFRSMERPKSFLVSVGDYEILEVREARIMLKQAAPSEQRVGPAQKMKENILRHAKEAAATIKTEKNIPAEGKDNNSEANDAGSSEETHASMAEEGNIEKESEAAPLMSERRRDRKKYKKKKNRSDKEPAAADNAEIGGQQEKPYLFSEKSATATSDEADPATPAKENSETKTRMVRSASSVLIPAPTTLISETIHQYKDLLLGKISTNKVEEQNETMPPSSAIKPQEVQHSTDFVVHFFEQNTEVKEQNTDTETKE